MRRILCLMALFSMAVLSVAFAQTAITPPAPNPVTPRCVSGTGTSTTYTDCTSANPFPVTTSTTGSAVSPVPSTALESSHVLLNKAGTLFGFQVNFSTCASYPCWVMLFDAASLPANGAVTPVKWYQVSQNTTVSDEFIPPLAMATGITVGCSTTGPFTLTATVQCAISGQVK